MIPVFWNNRFVHCEDVSLWFNKKAEWPIARQDYHDRKDAGKKKAEMQSKQDGQYRNEVIKP